MRASDKTREQTLRTSRSKVKNAIDFFTYVLDDAARTRRLVFLIVPTGACLALILFVLEAQPSRWLYVTVATSSVITIAQFLRRRPEGPPRSRAVRNGAGRQLVRGKRRRASPGRRRRRRRR